MGRACRPGKVNETSQRWFERVEQWKDVGITKKGRVFLVEESRGSGGPKKIRVET